jgi:hypothetical protein
MRLLKGSFDAISREHINLWYLGLFGAIAAMFSSMQLYKKLGIAILFILAFLSTAPGYRFYGHYFLQVMPAVAILIAAFVYALGDIAEQRMNLKWVGNAAFTVFLLVAVININKQKSYYFTPDYLNILRQVYGDNPFMESKGVADKIKTLSQPGDQLAVWGAEPQLYFDTQLHCPYRHSFISFTGYMTDLCKTWREEVKKDVEAAKPKFFVLANHPFSWSLPPGADADLYQWGYKYMVENYDLVGYADIIPGQRPAYVWDLAAQTYKPKGQKYMMLFKRKEGK